MYRTNLGRLDPSVILLVAITVFGFVLRIYDLGYQSLWYDEGYTINAALAMLDRGLPILPSGHFYWRGLLNTSLTASSMGIFGITEVAARLPSVLFGTLTIPLSFFFAKRLGGTWIGLITAFLVAFSTLEIAWSRQARMYQQLQFLYLLSIYFFYDYTANKGRGRLLLTILSTLGALLTHVLGLSLLVIYVLYLSPAIKQLPKLKYWVVPLLALGAGIITFTILTSNELLGGILSADWGLGREHFKLYWNYSKQSLPLVSYLWPLGAIFLFRQDYKRALLLVLAIAIPIYVVTFHIKFLGFRYLYLVMPLVFLFFACLPSYLASLLPKVRSFSTLSRLLILVLLGLTVYLSGFNFVPRNEYYLEPWAPQPDFKQAYNFINQQDTSSDIIIDTWPAVGQFYLRRPPDFWLAFDITGLRQDYFTSDNKSREDYTNTPTINTLAMLKHIVEGNRSGWLIIDGLALSRLPSSTTEFIEENMTYYEQGSTRSKAGEIRVYGWAH